MKPGVHLAPGPSPAGLDFLPWNDGLSDKDGSRKHWQTASDETVWSRDCKMRQLSLRNIRTSRCRPRGRMRTARYKQVNKLARPQKPGLERAGKMTPLWTMDGSTWREARLRRTTETLALASPLPCFNSLGSLAMHRLDHATKSFTTDNLCKTNRFPFGPH